MVGYDMVTLLMSIISAGDCFKISMWLNATYFSPFLDPTLQLTIDALHMHMYCVVYSQMCGLQQGLWRLTVIHQALRRLSSKRTSSLKAVVFEDTSLKKPKAFRT